MQRRRFCGMILLVGCAGFTCLTTLTSCRAPANSTQPTAPIALANSPTQSATPDDSEPEDAAQPGQPAATTSPVAVPTKEIPMLETLRSLCRTLSQDPLTAQDVAHDIGEIIEDKGRDLQIAVHPSSDAFSQAQVVRNQGTNEPAYVELTVSETKNLSVKQLAGAFGDYTQLPRAKPSSPGRLFFQIDLKGMPRTCAIIADLRPNESPQNGNVARITIRRDIRV